MVCTEKLVWTKTDKGHYLQTLDTHYDLHSSLLTSVCMCWWAGLWQPGMAWSTFGNIHRAVRHGDVETSNPAAASHAWRLVEPSHYAGN